MNVVVTYARCGELARKIHSLCCPFHKLSYLSIESATVINSDVLPVPDTPNNTEKYTTTTNTSMQLELVLPELLMQRKS